MPDREKAIKGLEHCCLDDEGYPSCDGCPYGPPNVRCGGNLVADAFALLKAQEPRVMTLEEVHKWILTDPDLRDPIYEETRKMYGGEWIDPLDDYDTGDIVGYGETVRCWTSRPTDEQREAVEWDS